ncbi:hypothetical protein U8Q05_27930 (plasmid) [Rhizobium ruizarguesonis]|nr:hypothetical protein U8Q05_27930 [Rhizobium ruizarguesonis]
MNTPWPADVRDPAVSSENEMKGHAASGSGFVVDMKGAFQPAANVERRLQAGEVDQAAEHIHETFALEIEPIEHSTDLFPGS